MGDHELMHAAHPAMYNGGGGGGGGAGGAASHHGMWWSTAAVPATVAVCSTELAGFSTWPSALAAAASYDVAAPKSCTTVSARASSESPGNNSSITFQEPTAIPDPAAVPQPALAGFNDWSNHPFMNAGGANLHGSFLQVGQQEYMSSSRNDHMNASSLMNPSSNDLDLALQGHHEHQLLSNLGHELLLSPTSPYGFQSSLLRSLMEPAGKPALAGLSEQYQQQQQQYQQMGGQSSPAARFAPAGAVRESLQFTNDAPYWNSTSAGFGMAAMAAAPATNQATARTAKPSPAPRAASKAALKNVLEGVGDSSSVVTKKGNSEPAFKKPRLETPSPLPTFKVRKEKLGDRVTALQQLVSPFGKTDTASVLHETIEYIKFLHDQVGVLSAPYLKNGAHHQHQVPQYLKSSSGSPDKSCNKDGEVSLKGRGLCLVPISSTFAVASEVPVDFWTPFGANFR